MMTLGIRVILFIVLLAGCSNRAVYENIQHQNRQDCQTLPPSQYDECMEAASKRYDEYKRERDEMTDSKPTTPGLP